jgi:hypothetical protein
MKIKTNPITSLTHLKSIIAGRYTDAKKAWSEEPGRTGKSSIGPPPPPKKSCLDRARNSLARTVAQIRTGHWRSAVYLKRIRKRTSDHCWFCNNKNRKMTRSHVLLHCPEESLVATSGGAPPQQHQSALSQPPLGEQTASLPRSVRRRKKGRRRIL